MEGKKINLTKEIIEGFTQSSSSSSLSHRTTSTPQTVDQ